VFSGSSEDDADVNNITTVFTRDASNFRNVTPRTATRAANGRLMGSLETVSAGAAYWVYVDTFQITLSVALTAPIGIASLNTPELTTITAVPGVNYVGVVDQSAQQTQQQHGRAGTVGDDNRLIETPGTPPILKTVGTYLNGVNQVRVYTYNNEAQRFILLSDSDNLTIGQGLLVFIAPDSTGRVNPIIP